MPQDSSSSHHFKGAAIVVGLIPWMLFTLVAQHTTLKAAAIVAGALALGLCLYSLARREPVKMLEGVAVLVFAVFAVIAFVAHPGVIGWMDRYARAVASAVLACVVLGSLAFVPFTAQYARHSVPRDVWSSSAFKSRNRQLTMMWGAIFAAMAVTHAAAGAIDRVPANIIFNWIIPAVIIGFGTHRTLAAASTTPPPTAA